MKNKKKVAFFLISCYLYSDLFMAVFRSASVGGGSGDDGQGIGKLNVAKLSGHGLGGKKATVRAPRKSTAKSW